VAPRSKWQRLATEAVNPRLARLDTLPAGEIVGLMIDDNRHVHAAIRRQKARISRAANVIASTVLAGGRLVFVGAGTSGRLGVLEAAELPPTFGIDPRMAQAVMAGGRAAVHRAKEGVEDDEAAGRRAVRTLRPARKDVVIGISASGVTPFVRGALTEARRAGAQIVGVTCDAGSPLAKLADVAIVLAVGPEVVAGSTRLKAGTATKVVLNVLTTAAMVRAGKTYGNLMVDVQASSAKLHDRAQRIVERATKIGGDEAGALLERAGWNVKAAILMQQAGISRAEAVSRLRREPRLRKHLRGR
jgi:N-acetylmuramic acid 6-phosphate etherase